MRKRKFYKYINQGVLHAVLILVGLLCLLPLFWMVSTSFKEKTEVLILPVKLLPHRFILINYITCFRLFPVARFFLNSSVIALGTVLFALLFQSLAAYPLARKRFPGKEIIFTIIIATLMIPNQVKLIPLFLMMVKIKINNTYLAIILPSVFNAFGVFLLRQFMLTIPFEMEDAAKIDGCNEFQLFYLIIVPLIKPILGALAIFNFVWAWNSFLWPLIVISDQNMFPLTVGIATLSQTEAEEIVYNIVMAACTISIFPVMGIFLLLRRQFIKGITIGAIKG